MRSNKLPPGCLLSGLLPMEASPTPTGARIALRSPDPAGTRSRLSTSVIETCARPASSVPACYVHFFQDGVLQLERIRDRPIRRPAAHRTSFRENRSRCSSRASPELKPVGDRPAREGTHVHIDEVVPVLHAVPRAASVAQPPGIDAAPGIEQAHARTLQRRTRGRARFQDRSLSVRKQVPQKQSKGRVVGTPPKGVLPGHGPASPGLPSGRHSSRAVEENQPRRYSTTSTCMPYGHVRGGGS